MADASKMGAPGVRLTPDGRRVTKSECVRQATLWAIAAEVLVEDTRYDTPLDTAISMSRMWSDLARTAPTE